MSNIQDKLWYACYGSNMLEDRFLCYIKGGQPNGAKTVYEGCNDKTLPIEQQDFHIPFELYFAKESGTWDNGGVAFIKNKSQRKETTLARIYLITKGQLIDIARQETNTKNDLLLDFESATSHGHYIFKRPSWYGNLLYLGEHDNYPVFTLTNENDLEISTKPSESYLNTIINGIKETHSLNHKSIFDYLVTKRGIINNYTNKELADIINK
ncbi:hypothetical protein [Flavobacterium panacagri]|uniref:hypothetical protein n=1 Tax=Flavobacterium panacagri TaxID=3034146 RepID=UPI0025A641E3|nr:hypothetical protein [Flavobacterium panacagri]